MFPQCWFNHTPTHSLLSCSFMSYSFCIHKSSNVNNLNATYHVVRLSMDQHSSFRFQHPSCNCLNNYFPFVPLILDWRHQKCIHTWNNTWHPNNIAFDQRTTTALASIHLKWSCYELYYPPSSCAPPVVMECKEIANLYVTSVVLSLYS